MINLLRRETGKLLFSTPACTLKQCLETAYNQHCDLQSVDLSFTSLESIHLPGINLDCADLRHCNLKDTNFEGASFSGASLEASNFDGANLKRTCFCGADLRDTRFGNAKLQNADLRYTNLEDARLGEVEFQNTDLRYARLLDTVLAKDYVSITGIGSCQRQTLYCVDEDRIWCGCWHGTLDEFWVQIRKTYGPTIPYRIEYEAAITFFEILRNKYIKKNPLK